MTDNDPITLAQPGWHLDPEDPGYYRYWNGHEWTDQRKPVRAPEPQPVRVVSGIRWGWVIFILIGIGGAIFGLGHVSTDSSSSDHPVLHGLLCGSKQGAACNHQLEKTGRNVQAIGHGTDFCIHYIDKHPADPVSSYPPACRALLSSP